MSDNPWNHPTLYLDPRHGTNEWYTNGQGASINAAATITPEARILGHGLIHPGATVNGIVQGPQQPYRSSTYSAPIIHPGAVLQHFAVAYGTVYGELHGEQPVVRGTGWVISQSDYDKVTVGCKTFTFKEWLAPFKSTPVPWEEHCSLTQRDGIRSIIRGLQAVITGNNRYMKPK